MLRAAVAALLAALTFLSLVAVAQADDVYSYWGLTAVRTRASLVLTSTHLGRFAHAAVWAGVSSPRATTWVQAGIENEGRGPRTYVEAANRARGFYAFHSWPARYGVRHVVRLVECSTIHRTWRAVIDGHATPCLAFLDPRRFAVVELLGHASASARIDAKLVSARR